MIPGGLPPPPDPRDRLLIGPPYGLRIRDDQRITDYSRPGGNLEVARIEAELSSRDGDIVADTRQSQGYMVPLTTPCAMKVCSASYDSGSGSIDGYRVLERWGCFPQGSTVDAVVRCLLIPLPVALCVVHGTFQTLMFSGHAVRFRPPLFPSLSWPPPSFWSRLKQGRQSVGPQEMAMQTSSGAFNSEVVHHLRRLRYG